ncbi:MAG TPA: hypothetical protein VL598_15200 [Trinickia sp.]|jgi:Cu/Ag efflux protein CusF|uniref:hypothetical protein n=1 Tax=Trinickia sp. TaxID=2571163 RepID=UPI002C1A587A|nr:hypothetical protein [Trinickia sp.]HTI19005.1 hypothetical protein [Trinickia sp.]
MKIKKFVFMAAVAMVACPAWAQAQSSVDVTREPGSATVVGRTTLRATVVGIERETRTVELKTGKGRVVHLQVGEEARNFDQLKIGDIVTAQYTQAVSLSLKRTSGPRSKTESEIEERAAPGAKPGGMVGREVTVMADVTGVNAKTQTVTVRGPQGNTVDVLVQDPAQLKNVKKGDQVEVVYTEALAISVTPGTSE